MLVLTGRCNRRPDPREKGRYNGSMLNPLLGSVCTPIFQFQFLEIARQSKALCDKYQVPLIINDRVDIALAVQANGVHLGQTDMPVHIARSLLPSNAIIGVSCNNLNHLKKAVEDRVDYIGVGAVWATNTKELTNPVIGVRGLGTLLSALDGTDVKAVAIGMRFFVMVFPTKLV